MTSDRGVRILAAPDKFRGTLTGRQAAEAMCAAAPGRCRRMPLADGGEGTLAAFGGPNRATEVTGPLGSPVTARWRLDGTRAVIEMAQASGLELAGGAAGNDPMAATTRGTGELIAAAVDAGAREIVVGVGGSATTDGGLGALDVLAPRGRPSRIPAGVRVVVCADVRTGFRDAARVFGPQKGATAGQVAALTDRLDGLRVDYRQRFGVDVGVLERSGAAGGLAGGLAALGAELTDGFSTIADALGFDTAVRDADLVVTGEGRLDGTSLAGKVVGGVLARCAAVGTPVLVVAGAVEAGVVEAGVVEAGVVEAGVVEASGRGPHRVMVVSLTERYGAEAAWRRPAECVTAAVRDAVAALSAP